MQNRRHMMIFHMVVYWQYCKHLAYLWVSLLVQPVEPEHQYVQYAHNCEGAIMLLGA